MAAKIISGIIESLKSPNHMRFELPCVNSTYSNESEYCKYANGKLAMFCDTLTKENPKKVLVTFTKPRFDLLVKNNNLRRNIKLPICFEFQPQEKNGIFSSIVSFSFQETIVVSIDIKENHVTEKFINELEKYYYPRPVHFEEQLIALFKMNDIDEYSVILDEITRRVSSLTKYPGKPDELYNLRILYVRFTFNQI
jgi:hypothetical protein